MICNECMIKRQKSAPQTTLPELPQCTSKYHDYTPDLWCWDKVTCPDDVTLSKNSLEAYFFTDPVMQSTGTAAVRGDRGFSDGQHYWEVKFLEPLRGTSVMVGVGTRKAAVMAKMWSFVDLLGQDDESWGLSYKGKVHHAGSSRKYCDAFFEAGTLLGVLLDVNRGSLTFFKDGESLGEAFTGLDVVEGPLYPMVSSTAADIEVELGVRTRRHLSLQERCFAKIKSCVSSEDSVGSLPLPGVLKRHILES